MSRGSGGGRRGWEGVECLVRDSDVGCFGISFLYCGRAGHE